MTDSALSSTRPYLVRAMHEWMTENNQTPLIVVDAQANGVAVPVEHVKDGRIVLNVAWSATSDLQLGNDVVSFQARFGGVPYAVSMPVEAIQGIYARESGQGMVFQDEPGLAESSADNPVEGTDASGPEPDGVKPRSGGANLRVIK